LIIGDTISIAKQSVWQTLSKSIAKLRIVARNLLRSKRMSLIHNMRVLRSVIIFSILIIDGLCRRWKTEKEGTYICRKSILLAWIVGQNFGEEEHLFPLQTMFLGFLFYVVVCCLTRFWSLYTQLIHNTGVVTLV